MMLLHRRNDAESSESQVERLSYRAPHWLAGAAGLQPLRDQNWSDSQ